MSLHLWLCRHHACPPPPPLSPTFTAQVHMHEQMCEFVDNFKTHRCSSGSSIHSQAGGLFSTTSSGPQVALAGGSGDGGWMGRLFTQEVPPPFLSPRIQTVGISLASFPRYSRSKKRVKGPQENQIVCTLSFNSFPFHAELP